MQSAASWTKSRSGWAWERASRCGRRERQSTTVPLWKHKLSSYAASATSVTRVVPDHAEYCCRRRAVGDLIDGRAIAKQKLRRRIELNRVKYIQSVRAGDVATRISAGNEGATYKV